MDYKKLLVKYIAHIGVQEGIYYLGNSYKNCFTDEEYAELRKLSEESEKLDAN